MAGALGDTLTARSSALGVARDIVKSPEGVRGLYRGLGAVVAGGLPGAAAYFAGAEAARHALLASRGGGALSPASSFSSSSPLADAAVGVTAQLVGGIVFTPVDVIKERKQAQRLTAMSSKNGGVAGGGGVGAGSKGKPFSLASSSCISSSFSSLFKGYWAGNLVWIPWSGIYFASYEAIKRRLMLRGQRSSGGGGADEGGEERRETPPPPPACVVLFSSAAAASVAALVTHPLDVVKTRMQVLSGGGISNPSLSSLSPSSKAITARAAAVAAWRTEGARAFWAGAGPRALQLAAGTALQWLMYEKGKEAIREATRVIENEERWV